MAYSQKVLAEEDFGSVKVELLVDSDGKFSARDAVSKESLPVGLSKNLADLKKKLRDYAGMTGKQVPAVRFDPDTWRSSWRDDDEEPKLGEIGRVTVVGIHAANGNVLIKPEHGASEQLSRYGTHDLYRPELCEEEDLEELRELHRMKAQVEGAIEKWKQDRVLDVRAALAEAPKLEGAPKKKGRG